MIIKRISHRFLILRLSLLEIKFRVFIAWAIAHVHFYEDGNMEAEIHPVALKDNAHIKRNRSSMSFSKMAEGRDGELSV